MGDPCLAEGHTLCTTYKTDFSSAKAKQRKIDTSIALTSGTTSSTPPAAKYEVKRDPPSED